MAFAVYINSPSKVVCILIDIITDECFEEAQATGKVPALCEPDSVFNRRRKKCFECQTTRVGNEKRAVELHDINTKADIQQYLDYCEDQGFPDLLSPGSTGLVTNEIGRASCRERVCLAV